MGLFVVNENKMQHSIGRHISNGFVVDLSFYMIVRESWADYQGN